VIIVYTSTGTSNSSCSSIFAGVAVLLVYTRPSTGTSNSRCSSILAGEAVIVMHTRPSTSLVVVVVFWRERRRL